MRKIIFYVQTMIWNAAYQCYDSICLYETYSYDDAERFCLNYDGKEENIFIQKSYLKETK